MSKNQGRKQLQQQGEQPKPEDSILETQQAEFEQILPHAKEAIANGTLTLDAAVEEITTRLSALDPEAVRSALASDAADEEGDEDDNDSEPPAGEQASDPALDTDTTADARHPPPGDSADEDPEPEPEGQPELSHDAKHLAERRTKALIEAGASLEDGLEPVFVDVPRSFKLRVTNDLVVDINAGAQKLERFLATHWYAKAWGVKVVE